MTREREDKIKKIARHYGYEAQSRQCIEEMAELLKSTPTHFASSLVLPTRIVRKFGKTILFLSMRTIVLMVDPWLNLAGTKILMC